jgi:TPR repeat protein
LTDLKYYDSLTFLIDLLKEGKSTEHLKWKGFTIEDFYANGIITLHNKPITEWEDLNIEIAFYLFNAHYSSIDKVISLSEEGEVYAKKCLSIWWETRFEEIKDIIHEKVAYYQQLLQNKEDETARSEGLYQLAWYHAQGIVFEKDMKRAFEMYQESAALGNDKAKLSLFEFYQLGIAMNKPDEERGKKYVEELVKKNHSQAIRIMGSYYQVGRKYDRNLKKAVDFYARSGSLGCTDGILCLGFCYFHGLGVMVKNVNHALGLFLKAASLGNSLALYDLAL